ncbi:hypothetical protein M5C72_07260 [Companilactobacillus allii]|uniref:Uncharacterized protein n=1 Tax=Companilactobacillus allii TaxID=1847728 RepID=A0A1P8Q4W4_9LACO|nr:hypothetical protein [Companilactobacillus allii]APX72896.1 hypothetical protein BTM29_10175 [Companilactobacillus allii]USQ67684.1 hypothetical protein M5C72_07260 [Companilactobacillus allii]
MNDNISYINDYSKIDPNEMDLFKNDTTKNSDGGGSNMDKYATKEELLATEKLLSEKIDYRFDLLEEKISSIPDKTRIMLNDSEKIQQKEFKDNRRFFWGTIIIGGISALSAVISAILTVVFH